MILAAMFTARPDTSSHCLVMNTEQIAPLLITDIDSPLGRIDQNHRAEQVQGAVQNLRHGIS